MDVGITKSKDRSSVEESDDDFFLLVGLLCFVFRKEGERTRME